MTEEKAIKSVLKKFKEQRENFGVVIKPTLEENYVVSRALESKLPNKPDFEGDGYDNNGNLIYNTWICPCCVKKYEVGFGEYDFCPNCGQKLDWRLEE